MKNQIQQKLCPVCNETTEHHQGNWKCRQDQNGRIFHDDTTLNESLRNLNQGFKEHVQESEVTSGIVEDYAISEVGGVNFRQLFAPTRRALKCPVCSHLILLGRLP